MLNAFTVDVEDYYHVTAFEKVVHRDHWGQIPSRLERSLTRILELLDARQVTATFFVLGWVADRFPKLVRQIAERGHELGSHSYWHRLVYQQDPDSFLADLRRSRQAIEDAAGVPVRCYRAPSFSITKKSLWALETLAEEGFTLDSSVFPVRHDRYGIPSAPRGIHCHTTPGGTIWEFPGNVASFGPLSWPISGGGYFRLYPYACSSRWLKRVNAAGHPFMFYIHPWEVDPDQPRIRNVSWSTRFRHYVNLSRTESKLEQLLDEFAFGTLGEVFAQYTKTHATHTEAPQPQVH